jgi:TolB-like protein
MRITALLFTVIGLCSCASNPVQRRGTMIAAADHQAHDAVASEERLDPGKIPARTVAVLPFVAAGSDTLLQPLGFALADMLVTDLAASPQLRMVERLRVDAILRELQMIDEGAADPRRGPRVGRLIGARWLVIGDVQRGSGGDVVLRARLVDVIAGTVEELVSASAPLARPIEAERALALRVFEQMNIALTPAQRDVIERQATPQLGALVAYGRGVRAEAHGDAAGAQAAFDEALHLDAAFFSARARAASALARRGGGSGLQRVLNISTNAINTAAPTKPPEAGDVALQASQLVALLITVRIF